MSKTVIDQCLQLAPAKVQALFITCAELGTHNHQLISFEQAFDGVWQGLLALNQQLAAAKTARGETIPNPIGEAQGKTWQRDRAFLVAVARLELTQKALIGALVKLERADASVRHWRHSFDLNEEGLVLVTNNLCCSYELYEQAAADSAEAGLYIAEVKAGAWAKGNIGLEHLRHTPPGFNRNWVLKFRRDDDEPVKYTLFGEESLTPPNGPYLSGWDVDRAVELIGASKFADSSGWVAVYNPARDHTGPKHYFRKGKRLEEIAA
jgi:hypothetical protein